MTEHVLWWQRPIIGDDTWMTDALCAQTDPEAFYPAKGGSLRPARDTCAGCPVADQCLAYALDNQVQYGIWGGLTWRERQALQRDSLDVAS